MEEFEARRNTKYILVVAQEAAHAYHEGTCPNNCYEKDSETEEELWTPDTLITVKCKGEWNNNESDEKRILRALKIARMYKTKYPEKKVIIDFSGTFEL